MHELDPACPRGGPFEAVVVEAPARLHMGFVDLHGGTGRRFGSLGLALEGLGTRVLARRAASLSVDGESAERARAVHRCLQSACGFAGATAITVERTVPAHAGLGSGTQLALAVGAAVAAVHALGITPREIARLVDRGARSGIGIGAFEQGGFILDGGRGPGDAPPPVVSRLPFPREWRAILLLDHRQRGLHSDAERDAFGSLPQFPEALAEKLAREVLMRALPALAEEDLPAFGAAVSELQRRVGDHFAPAQGGRFTSPRVARGLDCLESAGVTCLGQSSWGPTGFAIVASETAAQALVEALRREFRQEPDLDFRICAARNRGALVGVPGRH